MYTITIFQGKEKNLRKHHPWVFTGAIEAVSPKYDQPDLAIVKDSDNNFIAYGYYDEQSHIVLHLLSWDEKQLPDDDFLTTILTKEIGRASCRERV